MTVCPIVGSALKIDPFPFPFTLINSGMLRSSSLLLVAFLGSCLVIAEVNNQNFAGHAEVHDQEHIKQHMEDKIDVNNMSEEQTRFYYFSMHDLNKDQVIDGIEILKALTHDHENDKGPGVRVEDEDKLVTMIDSVLNDLDLNGDGVVDYAEYSRKHKGQ